MAKYVLTRPIRGGKETQPVGAIVDLTDEQAAHPLYRERVQPVLEQKGKAPAPLGKN